MEDNIRNNDQIYEGYKGNLGKDFQMKIQKRFLWMSKKIHGEKVLDIGCSSGIFSILLAREGKKVLGIDIDETAINKANELKLQEGQSVEKNVIFKTNSITDFESKEKYDTIILSEILEHLYYPNEVLKKVSLFLNNDGVIIITVPFGINSYFDHKKTYYLYDLFKETSGIFKITDLEFFDEWIGVTCIKSNEDCKTINIEFLKKMEEVLNIKELELQSDYLSSSSELNRIRKKYDRLCVTCKDNEQKLSETNNSIQLLKEEYEQKLTESNSSTQTLKEDYELKISEINLQKEDLTKKINELETINNNNLKKINELNYHIKRMNNRKIVRIIRKAKKIKSAIFNNQFPSLIRKTRNIISGEDQINMSFYNKIDVLISKIPEAKESNYYQKINLKIGIITDEYMFNYYKDAVNLVYIPYNSYQEVVNSVDMILFVSCWKGMDNNDYRGFSTEIGAQKVIEVFDYAKSLNKKIIFQTIEDPSNYNIYLPVAKKSDYIFTTASEMIENYKMDTGNENVFLLDYGINPQFHNPVGFRNKEVKLNNDVFFAGSWAPRYKERCDDSMVLFDGVINSNKNFILADRNYYIKGYEFPTKYYKYIVPAIDHEKLQKVHKLFNWALNLNSIKYSPTMCAMRIYELQAIGNLMISNYSIAVNNQFPNIFIVKDNFEVTKILNSYNEIEVYEMQVNGIRNVMSHHTVYDKLNYIFNNINEKKYIIKDKRVLVLCDKLTKSIQKCFDDQTYLNKDIIEISKVKDKQLKQYDYIAYMNEDIDYKKHYLEDMINAFKYTNSDFVSIESSIKKGIIEGVNHDFIQESSKINLTVFDSKKYNILEIIKNKKITGNGYSIDPFQIVNIKYKDFEKPILSVIIPIYNNGKFLLSKCFNSLIRSSLFNKMEIIMVDDGSNEETIEIINEISNKYANVKTYFFKDGGSGSASRPRNKGVELSSTKYITYLDPDNEAINDGYARLFDIIKSKKCDFAFGSIIKLSDIEKTLNYYSYDKEIKNPRAELITKDFKTNSIQACIIKKSLIVDNKIQNPVGAAGQDSLFFQELMLNAKSVYYLNLPIHIYYAARNDSIVNTISHKFFNKFLIMEKYQVQILKKYDVFEEYKERRYYNFLNNWYFEKLKLVCDKKEYQESLKIIEEIKKLYGDTK